MPWSTGEWRVHGAAGLLLREAVAPPPDLALPDAKPDEHSEDPLPGIRCPRCAWQPRVGNLWCCRCGRSWNTFLTRGRCPSCSFQWLDTVCLECHRWSRHLDWYAGAQRPLS